MAATQRKMVFIDKIYNLKKYFNTEIFIARRWIANINHHSLYLGREKNSDTNICCHILQKEFFRF